MVIKGLKEDNFLKSMQIKSLGIQKKSLMEKHTENFIVPGIFATTSIVIVHFLMFIGTKALLNGIMKKGPGEFATNNF